MKISQAIQLLSVIQTRFGDIAITGGYLNDHTPLADIIVTDKEGLEIWPRNPNGLKEPHDVDGVFLT